MLTISNNILKDNLYLKQYASLLMRLHQLMREGKEEEADNVRDLMDEPGIHLSEGEVQWVKRLSTELYSLNGEERLESNPYSPEEYVRLTTTAFGNRDADALLTLLRMKQSSTREEIVAYGRSRAYAWFGFYDISILFLRHAMQLSSDGHHYLIFLLNDLQQTGRHQQLWEVAQTIFDTREMLPEMTFLAVGTVFAVQNSFPPETRRSILGRLRQETERLLAATPITVLGYDVNALGYTFLGLIQDSLGRKARAEEAYLKAITLSPGDDAPWLLLGNSLFPRNVEKAINCFHQAIKLGTLDPMPYVIVAMAFLNQGDYAACEQLCRSALELNTLGEHGYRNRIASVVSNLLLAVEKANNAALTASHARDTAEQQEQNTQMRDVFIGSETGRIMDFLSMRLDRLERDAENMIPLRLAA